MAYDNDRASEVLRNIKAREPFDVGREINELQAQIHQAKSLVRMYGHIPNYFNASCGR